MLTRRHLLKSAALVAGGTALGISGVTVARRLLTAGQGGMTAPQWNDEFSGPNTDWTVAGSNDVDFGVAVPGAVFMESGMAIHRDDVPPLPFTVTAFCSDILFDDINTVYANATMAIADNVNPATTGPKFYGLEWDVDILGSIAIYDGLFADYGATPSHLGTKTNETAGLVLQVPHYQRLVVHSGTNVDLFYSYDGDTWLTYATGRNPNVTVQAIMLVSFGCETTWDWIRFS